MPASPVVLADPLLASDLGLLALLAAGLGTGVLSGLLGIGGVVIVPVLLELYGATDVPTELQAPLAIGTSHAAVLLASVSAVVAHARAGRVDWALVRAWLPAMIAGAVAGLALARVAPGAVLVAVFALVAALLGLSLLAGERAALPPGGVGLLAAALGVGGGYAQRADAGALHRASAAGDRRGGGVQHRRRAALDGGLPRG
jgi:uncharacterized membrane protein YfcA